MTAGDINIASTTIDQVAPQQDLTVMIFFRGHWCPFCSAHVKELNGTFREKVEAVGGKLYAVTSEDNEGIEKAQKDWKIDYEILSDRSLELTKRYGVFITPGKDAHGGVEMYPDGMSQPAVVAVDKNGKMIFRWAIVPSEMNFGGAVDRPLTEDLWSAIETAMDDSTGTDLVELKTTKNGKVDMTFLAEKYPEEHKMVMDYMAAKNGQ